MSNILKSITTARVGSIKLPTVELPDLPKLNLPKITAPKLELPKIKAPKINLNLPKVKIDLPKAHKINTLVRLKAKPLVPNARPSIPAKPVQTVSLSEKTGQGVAVAPLVETARTEAPVVSSEAAPAAKDKKKTYILAGVGLAVIIGAAIVLVGRSKAKKQYRRR